MPEYYIEPKLEDHVVSKPEYYVPSTIRFNSKTLIIRIIIFLIIILPMLLISFCTCIKYFKGNNNSNLSINLSKFIDKIPGITFQTSGVESKFFNGFYFLLFTIFLIFFTLDYLGDWKINWN